MTKDEYFKFHKAFCDNMVSITKAKNADYTGKGDNPFLNFERVEQLGICSTEQGFLTRMTDKFCRITSFVQKGELLVKDESVQDTLHDLANYCALMSGYIQSKKKELEKKHKAFTEKVHKNIEAAGFCSKCGVYKPCNCK